MQIEVTFNGVSGRPLHGRTFPFPSRWRYLDTSGFFSPVFSQWWFGVGSSLHCSAPDWLLSVVLEHLSVAEKKTADTTKHDRKLCSADVKGCTVFFVIWHVLNYSQGYVLCFVLSLKSLIWSTNCSNKHSNCVIWCISWAEVSCHFVIFRKRNSKQNGHFKSML